MDKITEIDAAWNKQKEDFKRITTEATEKYRKQETLINYFEEEMLRIPCDAFSGANQARYISVDV